MITHWTLNTHSDPLGRVHRFVRDLWPAAGFDALLLPPAASGGTRLLDSPAGLEDFDPFRPLMLMNLAKAIPDALAARPQGRLGVLLRPCEMRAIPEMERRGAFGVDRLFTICVDCLGTFPEDEFDWRAGRSAKGVADEALQFAPQGGIAAYRYRAACQMCANPGASEADVNIGVIGLPVREVALVEAKEGPLDWATLTDGAAGAALVARRASTLAKLAERHARRRERLLRELVASLPADLEALLDKFQDCGACEACMGACPICAVTYPRMVAGRYRREDVADWLASCAGCGMCEQVCPQQLPLSAIFAQVRAQHGL
jgi:formate dehydrogenase subunit beta